MSTELKRINNWIRWLSETHQQVETRLILYRNCAVQGRATKGAGAILVRRIRELRGWLDIIEQEITGEQRITVTINADLVEQCRQIAPNLDIAEIVNDQALPTWLQGYRLANADKISEVVKSICEEHSSGR